MRGKRCLDGNLHKRKEEFTPLLLFGEYCPSIGLRVRHLRYRNPWRSLIGDSKRMRNYIRDNKLFFVITHYFQHRSIRNMKNKTKKSFYFLGRKKINNEKTKEGKTYITIEKVTRMEEFTDWRISDLVECGGLEIYKKSTGYKTIVFDFGKEDVCAVDLVCLVSGIELCGFLCGLVFYYGSWVIIQFQRTPDWSIECSPRLYKEYG